MKKLFTKYLIATMCLGFISCAGFQAKQPEQKLLAKVVVQYAVAKVVKNNAPMKEDLVTAVDELLTLLKTGSSVKAVKDVAIQKAQASAMPTEDKLLVMNLIEIAGSSIVEVSNGDENRTISVAVEVLQWVKEALILFPALTKKQSGDKQAEFDLAAFQEDLEAVSVEAAKKADELFKDEIKALYLTEEETKAITPDFNK